jgi:cytochrome c biogenesis protein
LSRSSDHTEPLEPEAADATAVDATAVDATEDDSAEDDSGVFAAADPQRPSDHVDSARPTTSANGGDVNQPNLSFVGYLRFFWRQLTSMRTALFLLMLLALAAIPGSLVPQTEADPNGVAQYKTDHPKLYPLFDHLQLFQTYQSVWFSAIYLLLFVSLIGCILPRTRHHWQAMRTQPPKTPARLGRLAGFQHIPVEATTLAESGTSLPTVAHAVDRAERLLKRSGYRVHRYGDSVSAERGYLRETGNLLFHAALVCVLLAVAVGGGFGFTGQRLLVEGETFSNVLGSYDSFNPGRWFNESQLTGYNLTLNKFTTKYEEKNLNALGQPLSYDANVTVQTKGSKKKTTNIRSNDPLSIGGTNVYLLGNGYAVEMTVRDGQGNIAYRDVVPFLPQDSNFTSLGVVKVPDAKPDQLGMIGFFYPTATKTSTGAYTSNYPDTENPLLSLQVYTGNLHLNDGVPKSVYQLSTKGLTEIAGTSAKHKSIELTPGKTASLPDGAGSITFNGVKRYVSLDVHHDPSQLYVAGFALLAVLGLLTSLFVPRRRVWVKAVPRTDSADGEFDLEYAGLARGEDPNLERAVEEIAKRHAADLGIDPNREPAVEEQAETASV